MLNANGFIDAIRAVLLETSLTKVYSPSLPQEGEDIACISLLGGASSNNLCNSVDYHNITFRVLIRGTNNDTTAVSLSDTIYNKLHLLKEKSFTGGKIINCVATSLPVFVGKDENMRNLYNITFESIIK
jgi:hypothetical protein